MCTERYLFPFRTYYVPRFHVSSSAIMRSCRHIENLLVPSKKEPLHMEKLPFQTAGFRNAILLCAPWLDLIENKESKTFSARPFRKRTRGLPWRRHSMRSKMLQALDHCIGHSNISSRDPAAAGFCATCFRVMRGEGFAARIPSSCCRHAGY